MAESDVVATFYDLMKRAGYDPQDIDWDALSSDEGS
jgi:hypothetical protein